MTSKKSRLKAEYGDFQSPLELVHRVCSLPLIQGFAPKSIVEPTCGLGNFLVGALQSFNTVQHLLGIDINPEHTRYAQRAVDHLAQIYQDVESTVLTRDFFEINWTETLADLPEPLLFLGNPPWVTNAELASFKSGNVPVKANFQKASGIEAITGASNFDISEWMLRQMVQCLDQKRGAMAVLCKTSVARKILLAIWQKNITNADSRIFKIDAEAYFSASVDACLFVYSNIDLAERTRSCHVYPALDAPEPSAHIGYRNHTLVNNVDSFDQYRHLMASQNEPQRYVWRSGVKHDASAVMELRKTGEGYSNRSGDTWPLEDDYIYPLLKSSDLSNGRTGSPRRWLLVTQHRSNAETKMIESTAPVTWQYLQRHANKLDGRRSSIYRNRPRFSIFGIGEYSFSPWKVAISGMYKELCFRSVGSFDDKPMLLDDTCYFISCSTKQEAELIVDLLHSDTALAFYRSFIFWEDKRPITARVLNRLNLAKLADDLGMSKEFYALGSAYHSQPSFEQLKLLEKPVDYNAA